MIVTQMSLRQTELQMFWYWSKVLAKTHSRQALSCLASPRQFMGSVCCLKVLCLLILVLLVDIRAVPLSGAV